MKRKTSRSIGIILTVILAAMLFPAAVLAEDNAGDVWWKYDSRAKTIYISDEENKGGDYQLFTAEEQRNVNPGKEVLYGWIGICEDAEKAVIQGSPKPAETQYWFHRKMALKTIENLKNLDTSQVTTMQWMFGVCYELSALDLSGFDTSNVTSMYGMFYDDSSLTSLDVSNFNTSKVVTMRCMFNTCKGLTTLNVSGLNTSNVEDMSDMFYFCSSLKSIDISSFDVSKVTTMFYMFNTCQSLETIYAKPGTDWTGSPANMDNMFTGCSALKGGKGTEHSESHHYNEYVRIDDPVNDKPGYFTATGPYIYYVSFNMQGHGTPVDTQVIEIGDKALEPNPSPEEAGWKFGGWYLNEECGGESYDFGAAVTKDVRLFAKWTKDETVPPDDPDDDVSPNTGDDVILTLTVMAAAVLLSCLAVLPLYKRRS